MINVKSEDAIVKNLFVYGTLMSGQRAAEKMSDGKYLGDYRLDGYAMYNLGRYPGIIPMQGACVYGELDEISEEMIPALDEYEEEGSLYHRREVPVNAYDWKKEFPRVEDGNSEGNRNPQPANETAEAIVYVYAQEVKGDVMKHPWGRK